MKRLFTGIIVATSLLFASGCSSTVKSGETPASQSNTHQGNHSQSPMSEHQGHSMAEMKQGEKSQVITQAKLTAVNNISPNQPTPLVIDIRDSAGKAVSKFDTFQEKLMHLIVVREDLASFDHVHPDYKGNGRFEVNASFPTPGSYTLISDYKPSGNKESVSLMKLTIPGSTPLPKDLEKFEKTKILSSTKVNLTPADKTIKAGKEVTLKFDIKDAKNNQPIKDLQPYLGEKGHLVIIKSSSPLTVSDYIHAHALKDTPEGQVQFMTKFPQAGTYKIWMQFNRNGKINTADFWVNVQ
ncbi:hypothetical protein Cylst_1208 [Cylindrospermum stagnale PCC 7417]|uniref:YtkA-like domain-containing protein n=1 Tax=Cylindrospermum stagnale PCC 7417 TaxID=56107 RepID=K9WTF4_9NOST|nr:hypothetical protein [Cylindrospermum stagnale]AFZ23508.1 hypothetical protein Cylst_1208 [Cylindrospermum stagnale PCC 7417]